MRDSVARMGAATDFEDYRRAYGITDPDRPLGPPPRDHGQRVAWQQTRQAIGRVQARQRPTDRTGHRDQQDPAPAQHRVLERADQVIVAPRERRPPVRQRNLQHGPEIGPQQEGLDADLARRVVEAVGAEPADVGDATGPGPSRQPG